MSKKIPNVEQVHAGIDKLHGGRMAHLMRTQICRNQIWILGSSQISIFFDEIVDALTPEWFFHMVFKKPVIQKMFFVQAITDDIISEDLYCAAQQWNVSAFLTFSMD